jgi:HK97 family phage major capsid protein
MKSNDLIQKRDELRFAIQSAIKAGDTDAFYKAFDSMIEAIGDEVRQSYEGQLTDLRNEMDSRVLTARGVRQLTSEERTYFQKFAEAARSADPKQAVSNMDVILPKTTVDSVFEDLRTNHPLLSKINFMHSGGAVKLMMNTNGYQEAHWGKLTDSIVSELTAGFKEVSPVLYKLSAFMVVCKAMLDLGPEWLDKFVRETLYEALANGLEVGLVSGNGLEMPIGMNRQVGEGVSITGGVSPKKPAIVLSDLSPETVGNLLSLLAVDPNGKSRQVREVIFIVNHQDYFQKVMPATTVMAPDGTYRNDVMPYPMTIIPSGAVARGEAVLGLGYRYFAIAGTETNGKIEFSDHYRFLNDERAYLIKIYANGMPKDDNSFLLLDITGLQPATYKITQVEAPAASINANLAALKVGGLALAPAFAAGTTAYTADAENASCTITALPADASAQISVTVNDKKIDNGTAVTWKDGENTVKVNVTAGDGKTTQTYTVTVTKE